MLLLLLLSIICSVQVLLVVSMLNGVAVDVHVVVVDAVAVAAALAAAAGPATAAAVELSSLLSLSAWLSAHDVRRSARCPQLCGGCGELPHFGLELLSFSLDLRSTPLVRFQRSFCSPAVLNAFVSLVNLWSQFHGSRMDMNHLTTSSLIHPL